MKRLRGITPESMLTLTSVLPLTVSNILAQDLYKFGGKCMYYVFHFTQW